MYSDENKARSLAKQLNFFDYAIVDTSSLMEDSFPIWLDSLQGAQTYLEDSQVHIYVPDECLEELKNHSKNKENFDKSSSAKRALKILRHAKRKKIISLLKTFGNDSEHHFADKAIYVKVSADRLNQKILVITQDKKLASDLRNLNELLSQHGNRVQVYRLDNSGVLVPNRGEIPLEERNYKPADRSVAHQTGKEAQQRTAPKAKKSGGTGTSLQSIRDMDAHLSSNLKNRQYPTNKKIEDLRAQQESIRRLSPEQRKTLNLLVTEKRIQEELSSLTSNQTPAKAAQPSEPAQKAAPKQQRAKPSEDKSTPASPKATPDSMGALKKKLRFGSGNSLRSAIQDAASWCDGILFRYPTIPYQPQFHGPLDLTENDLDEFVNRLDKKLDGHATVTEEYKGLFIMAEPNGIGFKVWAGLSKNLVPPVSTSDAPMKAKQSSMAKKEDPKPAPPAQNSQPKPKPADPKKVSAAPKRVVKKITKKVEDKPQEAPTITPAPAENFSHPKLVILAPGDKSKRERIEAKVRYEKGPMSVAKQNAKSEKKGKPAKTKAKPSPSKPAATKPVKSASSLAKKVKTNSVKAKSPLAPQKTAKKTKPSPSTSVGQAKTASPKTEPSAPKAKKPTASKTPAKKLGQAKMTPSKAKRSVPKKSAVAPEKK